MSYENGEKGEAIRDFSKAIELKPEASVAYFYRGYAYSSINEKKRQSRTIRSVLS